MKTSKKVIALEYNDGIMVRSTFDDGRVWFVVRDIIEALGYDQSHITRYYQDVPLKYASKQKIQSDTKMLSCVTLTGAMIMLSDIMLGEAAKDLSYWLIFSLFPLTISYDDHAALASEMVTNLALRDK